MSRYEQALREVSSEIDLVSDCWFKILDDQGAVDDCADWAITGYVAAWTINVAFKYGLSTDYQGYLNRWTYQRMKLLYNQRRNK